MIDQPTMIGDVISQLIQLDIVSATTATALRHNPTEQVGNVHGFLDQLVGTGILTPFQRTVIGNGNAKSLRQGKYLLLDQIGEGGMGVVYKARHIRMERIVALKMLRSDRATNTDDLLRFRREVHTAAKLVHPNI
ncbi:MAG: protein kinase domain-containing protein, partial [Alphaproteobacteria bacterium]